jgi:hypothetical protein
MPGFFVGNLPCESYHVKIVKEKIRIVNSTALEKVVE